jgi:uncharacterized protein involved in tolerance to divalent cations
MGAVVVITTVGDEEQALLIARELVARRLAACVNELPGIRSVYRWQGKICRDGEYLLIVKTLDSEREAVAAAIHELHSYELPEVLSFAAAAADERFLDRLEVMSLAESLGGVETLISHPATMTHASVPAERRAALGIGDGLVRISVGIEDRDDLLADLRRGLDAV